MSWVKRAVAEQGEPRWYGDGAWACPTDDDRSLAGGMWLFYGRAKWGKGPAGEDGRRHCCVAQGALGLRGDGMMGGAGTRIASISGLRGIVGDGLDPATAAEFAAAYAGRCDDGPIAVGHDGRLSAAVFSAAVEAAVTATGHDAILLGPVATPTIGWFVRNSGLAGGIQISASHNPPEYNGLKFFQRRGMVLGADQGRALLDRWQRRDLGWSRWDALGKASRVDDPDSGHLSQILEIVDREAIRACRFKVALDACHGAGGRLASRLFDALGVASIVIGGVPDGRYDHLPEPTESNLRDFSAIVPAVGAAVGFAQDPDADRLALVNETGRYIGEELTLALAARLRLEQARGPVVINLSTSMTTETLASARLPGLPDARGRDPCRRANDRRQGRARWGRERRSDRSARRFRPRQLRRDGPDSRPHGTIGTAACLASVESSLASA